MTPPGKRGHDQTMFWRTVSLMAVSGLLSSFLTGAVIMSTFTERLHNLDLKITNVAGEVTAIKENLVNGRYP